MAVNAVAGLEHRAALGDDCVREHLFQFRAVVAVLFGQDQRLGVCLNADHLAGVLLAFHKE